MVTQSEKLVGTTQHEKRTLEGVLARIISTTQDAVIFIDADARVVEFNRSAEYIFGYGAAEVLGQNVNLLMPEPYRGDHDNYIQRYEHSGNARAIGTIRTVKGRRKNGETFPLELSITALPHDEPIRYAAFLRDISEKAALQERLLEKERLASLGMAASILAHEIGNPLNNMYLEAQLLERRLKKRHPQPGEEARAARIMDEIKRLVRLLEEFRHASRVSDAPVETCNLAEIGNYAALRVMEQARAANVHVQCQFSEGEVAVNGRFDKLKQVAVNLVKNAIEAMPEGGVLTIGVSAQAGFAVMTVSDTGAGVPEGFDILEAFRTTKDFGTGLGLAIVKQIVTSHRGTISWDSIPGSGSTFRVTLPLIVS